MAVLKSEAIPAQALAGQIQGGPLYVGVFACMFAYTSLRTPSYVQGLANGTFSNTLSSVDPPCWWPCMWRGAWCIWSDTHMHNNIKIVLGGSVNIFASCCIFVLLRSLTNFLPLANIAPTLLILKIRLGLII